MNNFREQRIRAIERDAREKIGKVEFICDYADSHSKLLESAFGKTSPEDTYRKITRALEKVQDQCLPHIGITTYNPRFSPDAVKLGWATLKPIGEVEMIGKEGGPYVLSPTKKGRNIVENYRSAQGLRNLEEQAIVAQESINRMFCHQQ